MKKTLLTTFLCIVVFLSHAQIIKPAIKANNAFADSLTEIVTDYSNNFKNIQGDLLPAEIDADTYLSKIGLPGATGCVIKRYHSVVDNSASWQAVLFTSDSYEEAVKYYKKVFTQIKKIKVKGINSSTGVFEGTMEKLDENVRFSVSSLRLKTPDFRYRNFAADIELVNNYDGWEVHLNLYKKKKDTEGGNIEY